MPEGKPKSYVAFDLGAESGRAVLGQTKSGTLSIREAHRFPNEPIRHKESLHWDVNRLWTEMRSALACEAPWLRKSSRNPSLAFRSGAVWSMDGKLRCEDRLKHDTNLCLRSIVEVLNLYAGRCLAA